MKKRSVRSVGLEGSIALMGSDGLAGRSAVVVASSFNSGLETSEGFGDVVRRLLVELPT